MEGENLEMAYLAGAMDADGSFSLIKRQAQGARIPWYTPMLQFAGVETSIQNILHKFFGGSLLVAKSYTMPNGKKTKSQLHWKVRGGDNCIKPLEKLIPYLILKKERARYLLDYIKNNRFVRGKVLEDFEVMQREHAHIEMKRFNARSVPNLRAFQSKTNTESLEFWSYVAGLMDTEGSFTVKRQTKNDATPGVKTARYSPYILFSMVNADCINYIRENCTFGKTYFCRNKATTKGFHYQWGITSKKDVIDFIERILPFMHVKKQQALKLVEFCKGWKDCFGKGVTKEQLEFREQCYQEIVQLNKNGVYKPLLIVSETQEQGNEGQASINTVQADRLSGEAVNNGCNSQAMDYSSI
jgi:hypothetical protein